MRRRHFILGTAGMAGAGLILPGYPLRSGAIVKGISQCDESFRAKLLHQDLKFLQCGRGVVGRQELTARGEAGTLLEVQIGDDQRGVGRPPKRPAHQRLQALSVDAQRCDLVGAVSWAVSWTIKHVDSLDAR